MNNLNSLILEGRIANDFEFIPNGLKIVIASSRFEKGADGELKENISFFDVEIYGQMATTFEPKLMPSRGIRVVGRLSQKKWKDEEGKEHSRVFVTAEHIELKPIKK
jgi:single-strand DNA-binding protein